MLKEERHNALLDTLQKEGRLLAGELSRRFGVSEDTIRRDLHDLARAGKMQRVHGGALPHSPAEADFSERLKQAPQAKAGIARAALSLLQPGQVVLMDGGTTTLLVARSLPPGLPLTVVTNSIPVAAALGGHPAVQVVVLGGRLFQHSMVTVGSMTLEALGGLRADLCLLGVCSLHPGVGISTVDLEESYVKRAMLANSRVTAALVTADKLGTASACVVAPLSALTHLVTGGEIPAADLAPYLQFGAQEVA